MKFKIQAGGEIDILSKDELKDALDKNTREFNALLSEGVEYSRLSAIINQIPSQGTPGIYAGGIYELGGPEPGFIWSVKNISFMGLNSVNPSHLFLDGYSNGNLVYAGLVDKGTQIVGSNGFIVKGGQKVILAATATLTISATVVLAYQQVPIKDIGKL